MPYYTKDLKRDHSFENHPHESQPPLDQTQIKALAHMGSTVGREVRTPRGADPACSGKLTTAGDSSGKKRAPTFASGSIK